MRILIVYSTTEGQTRKIARFMEDVLQDAGYQVAIADATDEPPAPDSYDAILLGGSIHFHKYQSALTHYVRSFVDILNKRPAAFFSVCMAIASEFEEEHREARKITTNFLEQVGWHPMMTTQIAGALKYTRYDFFKRLIMKMIAKKEGHSGDTSHDYEFTDWDTVRQFVLEFAEKAS